MLVANTQTVALNVGWGDTLSFHSMFVDGRSTLVLLMALKDGDGLLYLVDEHGTVFEDVQDLGDVHLEEHTGDLRGLLGVDLLDLDVQLLSEGVLLLFGGQLAELGGGETAWESGLALGHRGLGELTGAHSATTLGESREATTTANAALRGHGTAAHGTHRAHREARVTHTGEPHAGHTATAGEASTAHTEAAVATPELTTTDVHGHTLLLLHHGLALLVEHVVAHVALLGLADVQGTAADHLTVHLADGGGGGFLGGEADKSETAHLAFGVVHELGGGDLTELLEEFLELLLVHVVIDVLHVDVAALGLVEVVGGGAATGGSTLALLEGAGGVDLLLTLGERGVLLVVQTLDDGNGLLVGAHGDKCELGLVLGGIANVEAGDVAEGLKGRLDLVLGDGGLEVLEVDVGEHLLFLLVALGLLDEGNDGDFFASDLHAVDTDDGLLGGFFGLKVDEAVAEGLALLVSGDLAGEDGSEDGEGVVESTVVDGGVEVLDEHVASTSLTDGGVTDGPHDTDRAAGADVGEVQALHSLLGVLGGLEVDVGVPEGALRVNVTAHLDGHDHTDLGEEVEESVFGVRQVGGEVANIERARVTTATGSLLLLLLTLLRGLLGSGLRRCGGLSSGHHNSSSESFRSLVVEKRRERLQVTK